MNMNDRKERKRRWKIVDNRMSDTTPTREDFGVFGGI
jgi:hypothetical protein